MARSFQASAWRPSTWRASLLRRPKAGSDTRTTEWGESTFEGLRWQRARAAGRRWGIWGAGVGAVIGLIVFAPAAWLASAVERATDGHVILADARGSLWRGSAVAVLTGGTGSRDARSLPGRVEWTLAPAGLAQMALSLKHDCCINGQQVIRFKPGFGSVTALLQGSPSWLGQWPAAWLSGLGTPWNTLQLGGALRLTSPGLTLQTVQGRWRIEGSAALDILNVSSRVSTLEQLGSYRLQLGSDPANPGSAQINLTTSEGALQLSGQGNVGPGGLRFRGDARALEADQAALNNLLNIIGRRNGARSVIAIG